MMILSKARDRAAPPPLAIADQFRAHGFLATQDPLTTFPPVSEFTGLMRSAATWLASRDRGFLWQCAGKLSTPSKIRGSTILDGRSRCGPGVKRCCKMTAHPCAVCCPFTPGGGFHRLLLTWYQNYRSQPPQRYEIFHTLGVNIHHL